MTWGEGSVSTVPTWGDNSEVTVLTFNSDQYSMLSNQNAMRLITHGDRLDTTGGVDFKLQIREENFFVITSLDPRAISETTLNDPVF